MRPKSSRASESFKRVGILVLAVVLTLACLVAIGFLGTAPDLLSPSFLMATAQQTGTQLLAEPPVPAPSLPRSWGSVLSPPLPLVKIYLDHHYLFCKQPLKLVPLKQVCDGQLDCLQGEDEANCPQWVPEGPPARGECRTPLQSSGGWAAAAPRAKADFVSASSSCFQRQIHPAGAQQQHWSLVLCVPRPLHRGAGQSRLRADGLQQVPGCSPCFTCPSPLKALLEWGSAYLQSTQSSALMVSVHPQHAEHSVSPQELARGPGSLP